MRTIYRLLRLLGDARAVSKGPGAVGKRLARRTYIRQAMRLGRKAGL